MAAWLRIEDDEPTDPLFTGDDYQLVAEAAYREEDRRELFLALTGAPAPTDDHLDRLADLARRLALYVRARGDGAAPPDPDA